MVQYGEDSEFVFLGRDMVRSKGYSERTAEEIDSEVKRIIDSGFNRASDLIQQHRDKLEIIAQSLLEFETLDGAQVEEIIKTGKLTPPPPAAKSGPPTGAQAATILPDVAKPVPPKLPPGLTAPAPATA
jgi:cell division protease FtsH